MSTAGVPLLESKLRVPRRRRGGVVPRARLDRGINHLALIKIYGDPDPVPALHELRTTGTLTSLPATRLA